MILDEFATDLKSSLNLSYLLPHLMKRKLLTTKEEHRLKNQTKTDHDNNCEFIDYLKTKGSCAFDLFLSALRDETEHLGHVDLYKRMSERAELAGVQVSLETLPLSDSLNSCPSASISRDDQSTITSVNHVPQSPESMPPSTNNKCSDMEITLKTIMEQLDKVEKTVMRIQLELQGLRKVCDRLMLSKPWPEQESESDRSNRMGSRSQGNEGIGADYSSLDSETSTGPVQQPQSIKEFLPGQHDTDSLHSIHEEKTSNTSSVLVLPPKLSTPLPIGLHV